MEALTGIAVEARKPSDRAIAICVTTLAIAAMAVASTPGDVTVTGEEPQRSLWRH